jgi:myo-inositol 2-dehydrogenase/D-chiro-inositol 1-dehydrogenase
MGRLHAANLAGRLAGARLAALAEADPALLRAEAERWGIDRAYPDVGELLADPDVDAVIVATPTPTHADIVAAAAGAGKHVFCEKPIAQDPRVVAEACRAAAAAGVTLQVGYQRRFDPSFERAHGLVREGAVGVPYLIKLTGHDLEPPSPQYLQASGGIFRDMSVHDYDMARWLADDEVTEVFAAGAARLRPDLAALGDVDVATTVLRFRGGCLALVDNSRQSPPGYDVRVEVYGPGGHLVVGEQTRTSVTVWRQDGGRRDTVHPWFTERFAEAYRREVEDFAASVRQGRPPRVRGEDDLAAVTIAEAATRSLRSGRMEAV